MRTPPSLKARALGLLAQRDHSIAELRGKLLRRARAELELAVRSAADDRDGMPDARSLKGVGVDLHADQQTDFDAARAELPTRVDEVVAWLTERGYLSDARFAESRVHARAGRYGNLRIRQELAQHRVAMAPEVAAELQRSEYERAAQIWARKFGAPPSDARAHAKQTRFLVGRGFSPDVVRRVVGRIAPAQGGGATPDPDD